MGWRKVRGQFDRAAEPRGQICKAPDTHTHTPQVPGRGGVFFYGEEEIGDKSFFINKAINSSLLSGLGTCPEQ